MYKLVTFINITAFLSYFIVSFLLLLMWKRIFGKASYFCYILSFGIALIGIDNLLKLFLQLGYLSSGLISIAGGAIDFVGSILILGGFTMVTFELASTYELRSLEDRKRDINFLLSSLRDKARDGVAKEVINNLEKELIDIEKRIEELK